MKRLLIVDDDAVILDMLTQFCIALGHSVEATNDPRHALRILCEVKPKFDLIMTDFNMPVWSGLTLALRIRNFERVDAASRTPILCITSNVDDSERFNKRDGSPIDRIVLKGSFDIAGLGQIINSMTEKGLAANA